MDRRKALQKTGLFAGATLMMPTLFSILESCMAEPRLDWEPEFFTEGEAKTVSLLVDMILPRTDTPGALDVKSDIFMDRVIAQTYDADGQDHMRSEIAAFNANCAEKYGAAFIDLKESDRIAVLKEAEANDGKFNPGVWGTSVGKQEPIGFYRGLKSMAIWAYFTSQEMGENILSYDPIPGGYEPCKPLSEVGNRWSL